MTTPMRGLVAAALTPMDKKGGLNLGQVGPMVEHVLSSGVSGIFVCGSTGEGSSMTTAERRDVAAAFVEAVAGRVPVIVHVGHNSIADGRELAAHAAEIGAAAIAALSPNYFKPANVEVLVDCLAEMAAGAPELPFYYYHIPQMTGVDLDMVELLRVGGRRIPTFTGIKYTSSDLEQLQRCLHFADGAFDILFGRDECLLAGLVLGVRGAVGSTYNFAAPIYRRMIEACAEGRLDLARREQFRSVEMIRAIYRFPFMAACKALMGMLGLECGPTRPPLGNLTAEQIADLRATLEELGFFEWVK